MASKTEITETTVEVTVRRKTTSRAIRFVDVETGHFDVTMVPLTDGRWGRPCGTCDATGYRSGYDFVDGGRCWHCNATGIWTRYDNLDKARKSARTAITRHLNEYRKAQELDRIREQARREAAKAFGEWADSRDDVVDFINEYPEDRMGQFMRDMRNRLFNYEPLSENQEAAIRKMIDRELKGPDGRYYGSVGERITFTGNIVKTDSGSSDYGVWYLVVVAGTGEFAGATFKMMGSSPVVRELEGCEGDDVTITATVKKHEPYGDVCQTAVIRPKLVSHTINAPESDHDGEEPEWAGLVEVRFEDSDRYRVYPVNGTRDAWELITELNRSWAISSAYFTIFGYEWNHMSFIAEDIRNSGHRMGQKFDCLMDRNNTNYSVTSFRRNGNHAMGMMTVGEHNLLMEWRKAFGELQKHLQSAGHEGCRKSPTVRWECPEWIELNEPVAEVERRMMGAGMQAPYQVLLPR